jgi:ribosomal protein L12E/L44/L45/RPP1/RPP2
MSKSTLLDRLNHELENIGRKAQAALDEGKLQIELLRMRRKQDNAARDLGLLIHRRERGQEVEPRRVDALLSRLDDLASDVARLERQIAEAREQRAAQPTAAPSSQSSGSETTSSQTADPQAAGSQTSGSSTPTGP